MYNPIMIMMVGLPASGKSSQVKILAERYNAEIISSDNLRYEMYGNRLDQTHNNEVFKEFQKRVKENLINGKNVILDATNISIKSRRKTFDNIYSINCRKFAYIMAKPIEMCLEDNINREFPIPNEVINRMYKGFQIPFYNEGFDEIIIHRFDNIKKSYEDCLKEMDKFDQRTPHHKYDLLQHCLKVPNLFLDNYNKTDLLIGSSLHDYGKLFTQTFDTNGIAHYYGHEGVGAYKILAETELDVESQYQFQDKDLLDCLFLINYHMLPMGWGSEKSKTKWKKIFGEEKYQMLVKFNKADRLASGTERIIK